MSKVILVLNQKGGVGKTSTTVNLAYSLVEEGHKVLAVDIDPQGNTSSHLGVYEREGSTMYNVLVHGEKPHKAFRTTDIKNLDALIANRTLAKAEFELLFNFFNEKLENENYEFNAIEVLLKDALGPVRNDYDFIIVDCPPSLGLLTINALTAATHVLIPVEASSKFALDGINDLFDTIKAIKLKNNPGIEILGILLTKFDVRTRICSETKNEIKESLGNLLFDTVIRQNIKVSEAQFFGSPIALYDEHSNGAIDYKNLTKEVLKRV